MPCNCGNNNSVLITGGDGITVTGSGTGTNKYVISSTAPTFGEILQVQDTESVNLFLSGGAALGDPLVLRAESTLKVTDLTDVQDPEGGPQPGESLVWTGVGSAGRWVFSTLPPAPAGAVNVSNGINGTGTAGDPIKLRTSGVWGSGPLAGLGTNTLIGLATYIDATGQVRVQPPAATTVQWSGIANRPSTFPPTAHTHPAADIKVGATDLDDYLAAGYSSAAHTHASLTNTARGSKFTLDGGGNFIFNVDGANRFVVNQAGVVTLGTISYNLLTNRPASFPAEAHNIGGAVHTGILGIEKGGTGGNSVATALTNLGVESKAESDSRHPTKNRENVIFFGWDGANGRLRVLIDGGQLGYMVTQAASAIRFKDQITPWDYSFDARLDSFMAMEDYTYVEKADVAQRTQIGWMAERVQEAGFPEIVPIERDPSAPDFGQPTSVDYDRSVVILHAALKREMGRSNDLRQQVTAMEGLITALSGRLDKLEGGSNG